MPKVKEKDAKRPSEISSVVYHAQLGKPRLRAIPDHEEDEDETDV